MFLYGKNSVLERLDFNPRSVNSIADCVNFVLRDSNRHGQLVCQGLEHVAQHTWDKAAEHLENVFMKIMNNQ